MHRNRISLPADRHRQALRRALRRVAMNRSSIGLLTYK